MNAPATIDRAPRQIPREPQTPERLAIPAPHRGDLLEELAAYTASVHASAERSDLARLAGSIATGEVPETLQAPLARLLDLSLSTGRARRLHGPEAEGAFLDLYRRTPAGLDLARRAREAETALGALVGTTLTGISIAQCIPHSFGAFVSHHHRPARAGSPEAIARVQGAQPIEV